MIPNELKKDRKGIPYLDETYDLSDRLLFLDNRVDKADNTKSIFYSLKTTNDYIIKKPAMDLDRKERIAYMNMLVSLLQKQNKISNTEFPIGYYKEKNKLTGLIIKYYSKGISLDQIIRKRDFSLLKRYYSHSEDNTQNLFMLLNDYLNCLFELYQNDIYYLDIITNNIVIDNNQVKIIDFEPPRVGVAFIDSVIRKMIYNRYINLVWDILTNYNLLNEYIDTELTLSYFTVDGYDEAKSLIRKLEKNIR